jgi:hypothetical protein
VQVVEFQRAEPVRLGRHAHDARARRGAQLRQQQAREVEVAEVVDRERRLVAIGGELALRQRHAVVVHQQVQRVDTLQQRLAHPPHLGLGGEIATHDLDIARRRNRADRIERLARTRLVAAHQQQPRALARERDGGGAADAGGCTGDHCGLAFQRHGLLPHGGPEHAAPDRLTAIGGTLHTTASTAGQPRDFLMAGVAHANAAWGTCWSRRASGGPSRSGSRSSPRT